MNNLKNKLTNFMMGRYGADQYGMFLVILALVLSVLLRICGLGLLSMIVSYALIIYSIIRSFSKKIAKRRKENENFLKIWNPIKAAVKRRYVMIRQSKQYKFFRCPKCGEYARVPKKVGKVDIRCRKCGNTFRKKT